MPDVKMPNVGEIVYFFPNGFDEIASKNNADKIPALVIQNFGGLEVLNLTVFPMNVEFPIALRYSVPHKSLLSKDYQRSYWDWPEKKNRISILI